MENDDSFSDVLIVEKQPLPFSSDEETGYISIDHKKLDDIMDTEDTDSEKSDEEDTDSEKSDSDPKVTYVGVWPHLFFIIFVCIFGGYIFVSYLPILHGDVGENWSNYSQTCCEYVNKANRCSLHENCMFLFARWMGSLNKSLTIPVQRKCCYWYTAYSNYRMQALPYCEKICLQNVNFVI